MSELTNIERISEEMFANYHQMQHFITESPRDYRALMDQVAVDASRSLPKQKLTGLIIDESGWGKKGGKSVGVAPQYCGNVVKVFNSQVAVFGTLSNRDFVSMVDSRIYLPEDWCNDSSRCQEAGIPKESRDFKKKWELAIEIIAHQKSLGVQFDYVGGDDYSGYNVELIQAIEKMGYAYMLDIHSNLAIYLENSEIAVPFPKGKRGRKPSRGKSLSEGIRIDKYMPELGDEDWQYLEVRNTTKGKLTGSYYFVWVYIFDEKNHCPEMRLLVIRRTVTAKDDYEYKYSFTNANLEQYTEKGIAYIRGTTIFCRALHQRKQANIGNGSVSDSQVDSLASSNSTQLFVVYFCPERKITLFRGYTAAFIPGQDIKRWILLKLYRQISEDDMIDQMFDCHCRRQKDINIDSEKQTLIC